MLLIPCPHCGVEAAETEFHPGGEAHVERAAPDASDETFMDYLFHRKNPKGVHFERWRHQYGCGKWFNLARDTATLEVFGAYAADAPEPPAEILVRAGLR